MQLERITSWNEEVKTALKEYRRSKDKKWDITWTDESSGKKNKKLWNNYEKTMKKAGVGRKVKENVILEERQSIGRDLW